MDAIPTILLGSAKPVWRLLFSSSGSEKKSTFLIVALMLMLGIPSTWESSPTNK